MKKSISLTVRDGQCATLFKTPKCGGCTDQSLQRLLCCGNRRSILAHRAQTPNVISITDNLRTLIPPFNPSITSTLSAYSSNSSFFLNCALLQELLFRE